jgi:hypothetical protein
MLATSPRTGQIISGGSDWRDRQARQTETEISRAGLMLSMLYGRLNNRDSAGSKTGARVLEDDRQGVSWKVHDDSAIVTFSGLDASTELPWLFQWPNDVRSATMLTVSPRSFVTNSAIEQVRAASSEGPAALLIPRDHPGSLPPDIPVLKCPDRLADLDKTIEAKLLTSRIARS